MRRREALTVASLGVSSLVLPGASAAASDVVEPDAGTLGVSGTSASDGAVTVVWTDTA